LLQLIESVSGVYCFFLLGWFHAVVSGSTAGSQPRRSCSDGEWFTQQSPSTGHSRCCQEGWRPSCFTSSTEGLCKGTFCKLFRRCYKTVWLLMTFPITSHYPPPRTVVLAIDLTVYTTLKMSMMMMMINLLNILLFQWHASVPMFLKCHVDDTLPDHMTVGLSPSWMDTNVNRLYISNNPPQPGGTWMPLRSPPVACWSSNTPIAPWWSCLESAHDQRNGAPSCFNKKWNWTTASSLLDRSIDDVCLVYGIWRIFLSDSVSKASIVHAKLPISLTSLHNFVYVVMHFFETFKFTPE